MPSKQRLVSWWQSCVEEGKKIWRVLLWSRRYLYRQRHNAQTGCAVSRLQTLSSHTQSLSTCRRNTSSDKLPVLLLLNKPYTTSKWSRQWKSSWHLLTEIIQEFYIDLECCQLMFPGFHLFWVFPWGGRSGLNFTRAFSTLLWVCDAVECKYFWCGWLNSFQQWRNIFESENLIFHL